MAISSAVNSWCETNTNVWNVEQYIHKSLFEHMITIFQINIIFGIASGYSKNKKSIRVIKLKERCFHLYSVTQEVYVSESPCLIKSNFNIFRIQPFKSTENIIIYFKKYYALFMTSES